MKKLLCILLSLFIIGSAGFAQAQDTKKSMPAKKAATHAEAKPAKTKKDGTADMRYKDNKKAAKPAGPLKKDGTPDKRYKANKNATKK